MTPRLPPILELVKKVPSVGTTEESDTVRLCATQHSFIQQVFTAPYQPYKYSMGYLLSLTGVLDFIDVRCFCI